MAGHNRISKAEHRARMDAIEAAMLRRVRSAHIQARFSLKWGISERQVKKYQQKVRERWAEEGGRWDPAKREQARNHMRASLNEAFREAMTATEVVTGRGGEPVLDDKNRPVMRTTPDVRAALSAARLLMDLDALALPKEVVLNGSVHHDGAVRIESGDRTPDEMRHYILHGEWPADGTAVLPGEAPMLPSGSNGSGTNGAGGYNGSGATGTGSNGAH